MEFSCDIMNWYMMQASNIFYPFSERYQFEIDVRELHLWIKDRFEKITGAHSQKMKLKSMVRVVLGDWIS